ncbi:hypothetical protein ACH5RR_033765 [Cinchona calisaya]|uniref:hAT-like transposase RNase-H fold domain-containing protein n=1 Tax=Cinchona calisaya TaxID=153742 RepID=A0ABD2Y8X4_9GENT
MKNQDSFLSEMATQMYEKFEKYWSEFSLILATPIVFDPRYKFQVVEFSYKKLYGDKTPEYCRECAKVKDKLFFLFESYMNKSSKSTISGDCTSMSTDTCGKKTLDFLSVICLFDSSTYESNHVCFPLFIIFYKCYVY